MSARDDIRLDFDRGSRIGIAEAILCAGKTDDHLAEIFDQAAARDVAFLCTRMTEEQHAALPERHRDRVDYDLVSRTAFFGAPSPLPDTAPRICVVSAGTSDARVAREAARTLRFYGEPVTAIADVGVAGLHRLLDRVDEIRRHQVVIAVAGMDAALPTVLGGLVACAIVGVPTSTGYGAARGGETALSAMLASCTSGLFVVNIDNGFGAACGALRLVHTVGRAT
ncbi:MAG: nickel pincer cofactor biosynthesis protein LarB [Myxococcales bacterium]|nr:nickel pincer cofactor biosynthesis protein LarB [Myxococcales bacterium]